MNKIKLILLWQYANVTLECELRGKLQLLFKILEVEIMELFIN